MEPPELGIVRRAYAMQVMAAAGVEDVRIEAAFAAVKREDFLGSGPWPVLRRRGPRLEYAATPNADPVYLYTDDAVGILPERNLNNGVPSFHAALIAAAAPLPGEHVVHIGAGTGYYTAILAELGGSSGTVTAIELDQMLADRCESNFSGYRNVRIARGDGTRARFDPADVIYVNAGATHPADAWLDGLKQRGRLILPLTSAPAGDRGPVQQGGAVFCIERRGDDFAARRVSGVAIFPCEGGRDPAEAHLLAAAFERAAPNG